jgi:ABC-type bacteriocin/lantibiotic exporter with double-glycine peptidase domain
MRNFRKIETANMKGPTQKPASIFYLVFLSAVSTLSLVLDEVLTRKNNLNSCYLRYILKLARETIENAVALTHKIATIFQLARNQDEALLSTHPTATEKNLIVTWEPEAADKILEMEKNSHPNRPFMVGIVGIPGSGKSTSAEILAALLGETQEGHGHADGWVPPSLVQAKRISQCRGCYLSTRSTGYI